ncbi:MAG: DUF433 domain-containing protein [Prochlorotrichaceae cyanobacterium]|jgi:uncharacterized protein (DUF433 family)
MSLETYFLETYFDFLSPTDIRIKGHRIGIETVISRFIDGYSPEEIRSEYPDLSLEKIYATIIFYLSKKDTVDIYLDKIKTWQNDRYQAWLENPSPLIKRLQNLKKEWGISDWRS